MLDEGAFEFNADWFTRFEQLAMRRSEGVRPDLLICAFHPWIRIVEFCWSRLLLLVDSGSRERGDWLSR